MVSLRLGFEFEKRDVKAAEKKKENSLDVFGLQERLDCNFLSEELGDRSGRRKWTYRLRLGFAFQKGNMHEGEEKKLFSGCLPKLQRVETAATDINGYSDVSKILMM